MKILVYTENYGSPTTTFITNELAALDKQHNLLLIYSNGKNLDRYAVKNMVEISFRFNKIVNKLRWWLEQSQLFYSLSHHKFKKKINQEIIKFNPEIIHCHFGTDFLKLYANLNTENKKRTILISFYGYDVTERIKNKAVLRKYRKYLSNSNVNSIAVSNNLVNNINQKLNPKNTATLLYSGIDVDFFKRKKIDKRTNDFTFLQVSSFNFKKGHYYTLKAFKKFIELKPDRKVRFVIGGFGPLEESIRDQISELELNEVVYLRGAVTPKEMVELSSEADCFVHMSITANNGDQEGLPNVLLEAMALELPVLSTKHAGIPDIVEHNVNGILCEEKNIETYVEGFKKMLTWDLKPINREKIVNLFSINSHMNKLNSIYIQLLVSQN